MPKKAKKGKAPAFATDEMDLKPFGFRVDDILLTPLGAAPLLSLHSPFVLPTLSLSLSFSLYPCLVFFPLSCPHPHHLVCSLSSFSLQCSSSFSISPPAPSAACSSLSSYSSSLFSPLSSPSLFFPRLWFVFFMLLSGHFFIPLVATLPPPSHIPEPRDSFLNEWHVSGIVGRAQA